jgi:2-keto-4-pentenoate hydratase
MNDTRFDPEQAASRLVDARRGRRLMEPFSPGPAQAVDAYAVQDAVVRRLGPIAGWKVGAKGPGETPNAAPLLADLVRPSPAAWDSSSLHMIGVEAELAFRLGRDVKARSGSLSSQEVWSAIDSVHAAIEVVDTRLAGWERADRFWVLADNQSNGGFVYHPDGVNVGDDPMAEVAVRLRVDGRPVVERRGGNPAGDPRWLVEWLVNHCAHARGGLRAGMFITTGSYTGMQFVMPGACVDVEFAGVGAVEVRFS